jgi:hypothetical protein
MENQLIIEIKIVHIATPLVSDYFCNGMFFQNLCVDFEGKINNK